jgi:hypothetical protein
MVVIVMLGGGFAGAANVGVAAYAPIWLEPSSSHELRAGRKTRKSPPVLIAAGDIADCGERGDEATAALVRRLDGTVAALGDLAYPNGSQQAFDECYDPSWGAVKKRTRPTAGNHEYETRDAKAYFDYFGKAAGERGQGYYSYDLGAWHIIVLNSNCGAVGGCAADSPQGRWLRADLAAHARDCTLAYWHHPLFSSGREHGGDTTTRPFWQALYDAGADVVLWGHEHNYERFAPQNAAGRLDKKRGIRAFVVGSGGAGLYSIGKPLKTSEARNDNTYGVLVLTLHASSYEWEFVPAEKGGTTFRDAGSADCH